MEPPRFQRLVTSIEDLTKLVGTPSEVAIRKEMPELDSHMRAFIAASPFLLLGTLGRDGSCDVSPRGDANGVATVLDPKTLVIPERPGNRRADSLRNIIETGRAGLLFLIPGLGETLRVNGRACVIQDGDVLAGLAVNGKAPVLGIAVEVEECFLQCAKAVIRSKLWEPRPPDRGTLLASFAQVLLDQTKIEGATVESLNQMIEESYKSKLY